jgi:hypothetical protein
MAHWEKNCAACEGKGNFHTHDKKAKETHENNHKDQGKHAGKHEEKHHEKHGSAEHKNHSNVGRYMEHEDHKKSNKK